MSKPPERRKSLMTESLLVSVKGFISSIDGKINFGKSDCYIADNGKICIKAEDGSVWFVAVQKSNWQWTSETIQRPSWTCLNCKRPNEGPNANDGTDQCWNCGAKYKTMYKEVKPCS